MSQRIKMVVIADLQIFGDVKAGEHISFLLSPYAGDSIPPNSCPLSPPRANTPLHASGELSDVTPGDFDDCI